MKKLRLLLEYKCFPVWLYDENGNLVDNDSPVELKSNMELDDRLTKMQAEYDGLYEDSETQFEYVGFTDTEQKRAFEDEIEQVYRKIKELVGESYYVENSIKLL